MKRNPIPLLPLLIILSACGLPSAFPEGSTPGPAKSPGPAGSVLPTLTPICISPEPTQKDIDRALSFAAAAVDPAEWQRSYSTAEGYVAVTWQNIPLSAVIYLEARVKPCGYGETDLDTDFSDENWKVMLQNYESHELIADCRTDDGLRLYLLQAQNQGLGYSIRYWVRSDTDHRVMTAMFVFPRGSESVLDEYASRLFPELTTCRGNET